MNELGYSWHYSREEEYSSVIRRHREASRDNKNYNIILPGHQLKHPSISHRENALTAIINSLELSLTRLMWLWTFWGHSYFLFGSLYCL